MKGPVKQHYVPRFYLANFCTNKKKGTIYCYDKVTDKSFATNIVNAAEQKMFYGVKGLVSDEVEKSLARVESRFLYKAYNELVNIKNYRKLSHESKGNICLLLAIQLVRTSEARIRTKELREKVVMELAKDELAREQGITFPDWLSFKFTDPEYVKWIHIDFIWPEPKLFLELGKVFFNREWAVIINKTGNPLWTSDNPISLYNIYGQEGNLGIMSPGVEIRFPLTSELLLYSYDPNTNPPIINGTKISASMLELANQVQLRSSTRFVYSRTDDFSLAKRYLKSNRKFCNSARPRWKVFTKDNKIETIELE